MPALAVVGLPLLALARPAAAQYERGALVSRAVESGARTLWAGLGVGYEADGEYPLSGLTGDLLRLGMLELSYAPADGILVYTFGDIYRVLYIDEAGPPPIDLDEGALNGTTSDFGDFRLGTVITLAGKPTGIAGGLHLEVKLPNSDERKGIGTNTTDFFGTLYASYGGERLRATVDLGIGILQAPLEGFEQNDVFVYSGDVRYQVGRATRVFATLAGQASTRGRIPLGTEDRGELWLGSELTAGGWRFEPRLLIGYGTAGRWGLVATAIRRFRL